jgi:hypothetical protein
LSVNTIARFTIEDTTPPTWLLEPYDTIVNCENRAGALADWLYIFGGGVVSDLCSDGDIATKYFINEGTYLTVGGTVTMESFEGLSTGSGNSFSLPGFGVQIQSNANPAGRIRNAPNSGRYATDGQQYLEVNSYYGTSTLTFNFGSPINSFGMDIVDWGDFSTGKLTFMNNQGDEFTVAVAPGGNNVKQFFGVVNSALQFTTVKFTATNNEGDYYAVDKVYYGNAPLQNGKGIVYESDVISVVDECGTTGAYEYRFTATDACGNSTVRTASFIVQDTTKPVITPAQNLMVECNGAGNSNQLLAWLNTNGGSVATDNCGAVTWTNNFNGLNADCGATGGVTVTFTATDLCGNTSVTTGTLTINDDVAPVWQIDPQDLEIECNSTTDPYGQIEAWLASAGNGLAFDSCALTVTYTHNFSGLSDGCGPTGSAVVTFTARDGCGNISTRTAVVTVVDNFPPTITSPAVDETVECDGSGNVSALQNWLTAQGGATAQDACSAITWLTPELIETIAGCGNTVEYVYRFRAKDACNNVSAGTIARFRIEDTTAPSMTAASNQSVECDGTGNTAALAAWLGNRGGSTATDACNAIVWSTELLTIDDACAGGSAGIYRYAFTATDACGNASTVTASFTITDATAPVWSQNVSVVAPNLTLQCGEALPPAPSLSATDVCGAVTVTLSEVNTPGAGPNDGAVLVRTWTATDLCGNSIVHTQNILIQDAQAPVLSGLPAATVSLTCAESMPAVANVTVTDNCQGTVDLDFTEVEVPGTCPNQYTIVRTWRAVDFAGNSTAFTQTISVSDNAAPVLAGLPASAVDVECSEQAPAVANVTATDNCQGPVDLEFTEVEVPGTCPNRYRIVRTWTATDLCGNATSFVQTITINDIKAPVFNESLPGNLSLACGESLTAAAVLTATDNCGAPVDVEFSETSLPGSGPNDSNVIVRTWTAEDDCGNLVTHVQSITINDITPPVLVGLPAQVVTVECSEQVPLAAAVTATDNCQGTVDLEFTEVEVPGTCPNQYGILRTWSAVDLAGNPTVFTQTITVSDTKAPVFVQSLPTANLNLSCGEAIPPATTLTASDNCGAPVDVNFSETYLPGAGPNDANVIVRTWTASDDCGNATTHQQTITVNDTQAPVFAGLPAATVAVSCSEAVPAVAIVTATDNCQGTVDMDFTEVEVPGTCPNQYSVVRTWTAVDFAGNSAVFTQTITINDTQAPVFAQALPAASLNLSCGEAVPAAAALTATDNCGAPVDVEFSETVQPGAGPNDANVIVRTWSAEDDCGNAVVHTQTITINDTQAPVFAGLPSATVNVECAEQVPAVANVRWMWN